MSEVSRHGRTWRQQAVSATVYKACPNCASPGVYDSNRFIQANYPANFVEPDDPRHGQPVGSICPKCNTLRDPGLTVRLGEIWRKIWD